MNVKKSYGIVLCRKNERTNKWEVLAVKKRNTYAFVEFILKKHHRTDEKKILYLLNNMTYDEKVDLLSLNFGHIWHRFQLFNPDSLTNPPGMGLSPEDYEKYKIRKYNFERTFLTDKGKLLKRLISKSRNTTNNWELPKGRRNGPELELNCAIRETTEETGLYPVDYTLLVHEPLLKLVQATSFVRYESYYYIGIMEDHRYTPKFPERLSSGKPSEIAEIQWMTLDKISIVDPSEKLNKIAEDALTIVRKKYKYDKILISSL
jgi:8-oxo-dGTP pyrophosphatase MutT (NUDIX family)